jgi:RNA-directed DNA polymerase
MRLGRGRRQATQGQLQLALDYDGGHVAAGVGVEPCSATDGGQSPARHEGLMERICEPRNLVRALSRVVRNGGSPGVDGMTVMELREQFPRWLPILRAELLSGQYRPTAVKRVEIPKPGGGVRLLGVPTVRDRLVQQAMLQVLSPLWDASFSERSYGFRPGRSAHDAVGQAEEYLESGLCWVVSLDLEKFFDRVNHDRLMHALGQRIGDKALLRLIGSFLRAGVLEHGLVSPGVEGTPQGGPLSPLLSNIVLDELDRELTRRGHAFVRYADDVTIFVRSEQAGLRVLASVTRVVEKRLKLRVNPEKSAVSRPQASELLGFTFAHVRRTWVARPSRRSVDRLKHRVRELTRRSRGVRLERVIGDVASLLRGWVGYFGLHHLPRRLRDEDCWIRRRLRCYLWSQWKTGRRRYAELTRRRVADRDAGGAAWSQRGAWRLSHSHAVQQALPNSFFTKLGLPTLEGLWNRA